MYLRFFSSIIFTRVLFCIFSPIYFTLSFPHSSFLLPCFLTVYFYQLSPAPFLLLFFSLPPFFFFLSPSVLIIFVTLPVLCSFFFSFRSFSCSVFLAVSVFPFFLFLQSCNIPSRLLAGHNISRLTNKGTQGTQTTKIAACVALVSQFKTHNTVIAVRRQTSELIKEWLHLPEDLDDYAII